MAEGDRVDSLYIVVSGRLKVMMGEADGKEVILSIIGPGEFFGEMGLIDDNPRSASVIAIEPCELLSVTKRAFKKCLVENIEVGMAVLRVVVRRLREADRKLGSLAMLDVYGRVARLLLDMAEDVDGQKVVTRRLTKQDIGRMVGASREMVHKVMKDLEMSGYFEVRGSTIVLRDTIPPPQ
jgi:CRP/FNR family cyclic AMP-dependent transcriptional regulator